MDANRKTITLGFLLNTLQQSQGSYGYDIWISEQIAERTLLWRCAIEILKSEPPPPYVEPTNSMMRVITYGEDNRETKVAKELFPLACDILWQLCLRGMLRPGIRTADGQSVNQGQGYSLTLKGREWVKSPSENDIRELLEAL